MSDQELELRRRVSEAPSDADAWFDLGRLLTGKSHFAQASWKMGVCSGELYQEAFDEAREALTSAARLDPNGPHRWLALAQLLVELEERPDYDADALAALDRVVTLSPLDAESWCLRAEVCDRLGDRDGALQSLRRAAALDPDAPRERGWAFEHLKEQPGFRELLADLD